jgi:hypothetical protein
MMTATCLRSLCVTALVLGAVGCSTYDHGPHDHPDDGAADSASPADADDARASDGAPDATAQDGGGEDAQGMDADASVADGSAADAMDAADVADAGHADAADVAVDGAVPTNLIRNGSFETTGSMWLAPWYFQTRDGGMGGLVQDPTNPEGGMYSLRAQITQAGSLSWYVQLAQGGLSMQSGVTYTLTLWVRGDQNRMIDVAVQDDGAPYARYYGTGVPVTTTWQRFTATFTASATARVMFVANLGSTAGQVWLDEVSLSP